MKNDLDLRRDLLDELESEPSVDAAHIGVAARDGVITLTGAVKSYSEKLAAERVVKRVRGVSAIANDIDVRLPGAEAAFRRSAELDAHKVRVETRDGKVTLRGDLHSWSERQEAGRTAWAAPGVTNVENLIVVRP